jgi:hypothetical protein
MRLIALCLSIAAAVYSASLLDSAVAMTVEALQHAP